MNIQKEDVTRINSLVNILGVPDCEVIHMAVSLLMLKIKLSTEDKELCILDKSDNSVSGIKYGINSK